MWLGGRGRFVFLEDGQYRIIHTKFEINSCIILAIDFFYSHRPQPPPTPLEPSLRDAREEGIYFLFFGRRIVQDYTYKISDWQLYYFGFCLFLFLQPPPTPPRATPAGCEGGSEVFSIFFKRGIVQEYIYIISNWQLYYFGFRLFILTAGTYPPQRRPWSKKLHLYFGQKIFFQNLQLL